MSVQIAFSNACGLLSSAVEREIRAGIDEGLAALEAQAPWHEIWGTARG